MKKQLVQPLAILFAFVYQLSQAQTHEILFKTGQAFKSTSKEPVDPRQTNSKTGRQGFGFDFGYGYYFKNDHYLRLCGSYSSTAYFSKSSNDAGIYNREMSYKEKSESYGAHLEFGKRLHYKFIDFLAGVGAGFYNAPSHKADEYYYFTQETPIYPGQLMQSESRTVTTVPGAMGANLYLNTALYFKIWKPLYIGVEVSNGIAYSKQKGNQLDETLNTYSNGPSYSATSRKYVEETQVGLQLFRTQLALRYFFGAKKTALVPEQAP
jgi:hypothetical protein